MHLAQTHTALNTDSDTQRRTRKHSDTKRCRCTFVCNLTPIENDVDTIVTQNEFPTKHRIWSLRGLTDVHCRRSSGSTKLMNKNARVEFPLFHLYVRELSGCAIASAINEFVHGNTFAGFVANISKQQVEVVIATSIADNSSRTLYCLLRQTIAAKRTERRMQI